jgi:hypothetical protein
MKINILILNKWYKTFILIFSIFVLVSCEKYLDVNTDPDSPNADQVNEKLLLPGIEGVVSFNIVGGYPARYPNYWIGQLSSSAEAPTAETFNIFPADVDNTWTYDIYTNSLKNSILLNKKAENSKNYYYLGISKVLSAQILAITTDLWGSIPWSEAFHYPSILKPKFDTQESIYSEVFRLLNEGISDLKNKTAQSIYPGNDDLLYGGDIDKWIKYAYSIKARYALRLTYAPGKSGTAQADTALNAITNAFKSNSDDADFAYYSITNNENPWYQWGIKWTPVYVNSFMLNLMNNLKDPRIYSYFSKTENDNLFIGHRNGTLIDVPGSVSIVVGTSKAGSDKLNFIQKNSPLSWMTFAELKFIEAEAYAWKSNYTKASDALKVAVKANMSKIGVPIDSINNFVLRLGDLPNNFEAAQKIIIEQKYIANFLSLENWNDYRRTGYPRVSASDIDNPTHENIPLRFMYSSDVRLNNSENMPVVDWLKDRLWWDAKNK